MNDVSCVCMTETWFKGFMSPESVGLAGYCCERKDREDLTRFNKIAIQGAPQMAVDKEAISLSRVYSYYSKCNLPLFYV